MESRSREPSLKTVRKEWKGHGMTYFRIHGEVLVLKEKKQTKWRDKLRRPWRGSAVCSLLLVKGAQSKEYAFELRFQLRLISGSALEHILFVLDMLINHVKIRLMPGFFIAAAQKLGDYQW